MKSKHLFLILMIFSLSSFSVSGQTDEELAKGYSFIETRTFSQEENEELLKLYEGLRVTDVSDGMDKVGLPNTGLVSPEIHPDWVDVENMSHVIRGIAVTARYVPTQRPDRPAPGEDFDSWEGNFYSKYSSELFAKVITPGSVVVLDDVEDRDIGTIGSFNILIWQRLGAVGVVTDASARDTDEIALQKVPLYLRKKGRGIRPGRNELESVNRPVDIGGVLVCPGDVVVADGDGVVVVPRKVAGQVALYATGVLDKDKENRAREYKLQGREPDETVR